MCVFKHFFQIQKSIVPLHLFQKIGFTFFIKNLSFDNIGEIRWFCQSTHCGSSACTPRNVEVENTDRTVAGVYTKQKYQKKPCCFATKKRKKDVGTQLTHIRQPRTAQAAIACGGLIYLLSLTTSEVSA